MLSDFSIFSQSVKTGCVGNWNVLFGDLNLATKKMTRLKGDVGGSGGGDGGGRGVAIAAAIVLVVSAANAAAASGTTDGGGVLAVLSADTGAGEAGAKSGRFQEKSPSSRPSCFVDVVVYSLG